LIFLECGASELTFGLRSMLLCPVKESYISLSQAVLRQRIAVKGPEIVPANPEGRRPRDDPDFSLVLGGPLYQLYLRTRLARPPLELAIRRVVGISLICWLPLLLLTAIAGRLTSGVSIPFLQDVEVHVKLLLVLPMLIAAEVVVDQRLSRIVAQFSERGIIAREDQSRFDGMIASAMRLRNSIIIEFLLIAAVVAFGFWMWRGGLKLTLSAISVSSWYAVNEGAGLHLTAAGSYYALFGLSILRFIMLRWYFRLFVWYRFLWQVRGLPLQLNLYHPDHAGGLGFLGATLIAFSPIFVAQSAALAAVIFTQIRYTRDTLPAFTLEIAGVLLFFVIAEVLPLTFFTVHLERAGRRARIELGVLASRYVTDFRGKWVLADVRQDLLGTPDLQSLADLANSFNVVSAMGLLPVSPRALLRLTLLIASPMLPLLLTVIPLSEIIKRLIKMLF
jgi:hypothetical protein